MSLADEENVQPLLSEQDVETGEPREDREVPPHADPAQAPAEEEEESSAVPRTHADLDTAADERGVVWSEEGLTVAQKQAELEAAKEEEG